MYSLDGMVLALVALRGNAQVRAPEGSFPRASPSTCVPSDPQTKEAAVDPDPVQQAPDHPHMLGSPGVGSGDDRQLRIAQREGIGRPALHHRRGLKRLGRRAKDDLHERIAGNPDEPPFDVDDRDGSSVEGLHGAAADHGRQRLEARVESHVPGEGGTAGLSPR